MRKNEDIPCPTFSPILSFHLGVSAMEMSSQEMEKKGRDQHAEVYVHARPADLSLRGGRGKVLHVQHKTEI